MIVVTKPVLDKREGHESMLITFSIYFYWKLRVPRSKSYERFLVAIR